MKVVVGSCLNPGNRYKGVQQDYFLVNTSHATKLFVVCDGHNLCGEFGNLLNCVVSSVKMLA